MQTIYIKNKEARVQYALFLEQRGKKVVIEADEASRPILKTDIRKCNLPA